MSTGLYSDPHDLFDANDKCTVVGPDGHVCGGHVARKASSRHKHLKALHGMSVKCMSPYAMSYGFLELITYPLFSSTLSKPQLKANENRFSSCAAPAVAFRAKRCSHRIYQ